MDLPNQLSRLDANFSSELNQIQNRINPNSEKEGQQNNSFKEKRKEFEIIKKTA